MREMRVWWIPQVGIDGVFYVPVKDVEEGKKVMDTLAAYDAFQFKENVKPDYCNVGGIEVREDGEDWEDWSYCDDTDFYDDVDEYIEEKSDRKEEVEAFSEAMRKYF